MRFQDLIQILDRSLLNEANVYNVDLTFNGVSLSKFLQPYIANVSEASRKPLQKKLTKLLMNNEKFLKKMEKLPANAPDWAKQAIGDGQLMYFQPSDTLEGAIEHITHYVAALEQDEKSTDPNKKAVATRELAGIAKAENLDLLITKSNEYFARGSKNVATSNEGSTEIFAGANGYTWYRLDTLDAYKREGKVLQNCIGTHWTPSKADRIYVMKGRNGDTNVAIRTDTNNTIQEVKGKNNKAPVARYMPAVAELINHMKWKVQGYGAQDIANAGYVFVEGILYSRAAAIEKFVTRKTIVKTDNYQIDQLTAEKLDEELRHIVLGYSMYSRIDSVYAFVSNGQPILTANVHRKELKELHQTLGQVDVTDRKNGPIPTFIKALIDSGLVDRFSEDVVEGIRSTAGIAYDQLKKSFREVGSVKTVTDIDTPETQRELTSEEIEHVRETVMDWISDSGTSSVLPEWMTDIKRAYMSVLPGTHSAGYRGSRSTDTFRTVQLALVDSKNRSALVTLHVGRDSHHVNVLTTGFGMRPSPQQTWVTVPDEKSSEVWTKMANEHKFKLPPSFMLNSGIIDKDGEYAPVRLSELKTASRTTEDGHQIFDLSRFDGIDRLTALITVTKKLTGHAHTLYMLTQAVRDETSKRTGTPHYQVQIQDREDGFSFSPDSLNEFIKKNFPQGIPDKIARVKIDMDGDDKNILLFINGKSVTRIGETNDKMYVTDARSHEALAAGMNKVAQELGVQYDPTAMTKNELALIDGVVHTQHSLRAKELEAEFSKNPMKEIRFEDGTTIERVAPRDMIDFYSVGPGRYDHSLSGSTDMSKTGEKSFIKRVRMYEIKQDGKTVGMFTVADGTVKQLFGYDKKKYRGDYAPKPQPSKLLSRRDIPQKTTADTELMKYVVAAGQKLNFTVNTASAPVASPNETPHRLLRALARVTEPLPRTQAFRAAGVATVNGWETSPTPHDRRLWDAGFVDMTRTGKSYQLSINARGRAALDVLNGGRAVRLTPVYKPVRVLDDGEEIKKPEPQVQPAAARPAPTARPPGAGTKAEQAQQLWDAAVAAGGVPARAEFIRQLVAQVGMTPAGAATYYHNIKTKHARAQGQVAESFTFTDFLFYIDR